MFLNALTCDVGFYWEMHMAFLFLFTATKMFELYLYRCDPTLTVEELSPGRFLRKFALSCLGYFDAYQDGVSAAIALSCDTPASQRLGTAMLVFYIVGVVMLQWCAFAYVAFQDASKACFFRVLHMDTIPLRLKLDRYEVNLLKAQQISRTVWEDIPQALLQTIYICTVSQNFFMICSVFTAVAGSLMAMWGAMKQKASTDTMRGSVVGPQPSVTRSLLRYFSRGETKSRRPRLSSNY